VGFGFLNKVIPNLPIQRHSFPPTTFITFRFSVTVLFAVTCTSWPISWGYELGDPGFSFQ
jgi:hypothetical protein